MHAGSFLRGVLDKLGVEPQVQRIGRYKRYMHASHQQLLPIAESLISSH